MSPESDVLACRWLFTVVFVNLVGKGIIELKSGQRRMTKMKG